MWAQPDRCLGEQIKPLLDMHSSEEKQNELTGKLGAFGLKHLAEGRLSRAARSTPLGIKQIGVHGASWRKWPISGRERACRHDAWRRLRDSTSAR